MKAKARRDMLLPMNRNFVELRVHGVALDGGDGMPVVLLIDDVEGLGVPVSVGPFEASAIILELEGISPPRPLTHDLLAEIFREAGLSLERAELFGEASSDAQARLVYRRGLSRRTRLVRPSDAIALAIRLKAPIQAERSLLSPRSRAEESITAFSSTPESYFVRSSDRPY
jgi:bifunctional DNase/RNase